MWKCLDIAEAAEKNAHNKKINATQLTSISPQRIQQFQQKDKLFIYRYLEHQLNDKYTVDEIVSKLQEMKLLEHKGKGFEPIQDRNELTDDLHHFLGINTDNEIITYKKLKKILDQESIDS